MDTTLDLGYPDFVYILRQSNPFERSTSMYLPKIYEQFSKKYPEVFQDYNKLGISTRKAGPLDEKTQDLVKLGIALGANSRGAVMSHTRKARDAGATPEEIAHVVLLGLTTTGFPNMIAAWNWVQEVLSENR
jgi:4-carboxymuconolactone decarboxylase